MSFFIAAFVDQLIGLTSLVAVFFVMDYLLSLFQFCSVLFSLWVVIHHAYRKIFFSFFFIHSASDLSAFVAASLHQLSA